MWEQRLIETERGVFELFEKGQGEPLAITHLYSAYDTRGNSFAHPFTANYKVYLINLRGAGHSVSAANPDEYSMDETVKDLEAIRVALKLEQWGFAGHSTGGMLALKYAILAPTSLTKIIAGGAAASMEYGTDPNCIYCHENPNFQRIVYIMEQLNDPTTSIEERQKYGYEWSLVSYYSEDKLKEALQKPNSGKTVGPRLDYFRKIEYSTYDIREQLKNITTPSYIYAGKHDAQCPYKFGVEIAQLIPNAQFTTFEKSNHNPYSEEEELFQAFVTSTLVSESSISS